MSQTKEWKGLQGRQRYFFPVENSIWTKQKEREVKKCLKSDGHWCINTHPREDKWGHMLTIEVIICTHMYIGHSARNGNKAHTLVKPFW